MIQKLKSYLFGDAPLQARIFYIVAAGALIASLVGPYPPCSATFPILEA